MAKNKECLITVDLAYALRDILAVTDVPDSVHGFRCVACRQPVRPVSVDGREPYFEHLKPNPNCSLSYETPRNLAAPAPR